MPDRVVPWPLLLVHRLASLNALAFHVAPALLRPHIASSALPEARLSCIVQRRGVLHFEQLHKMGSVVVPWFLACELHALQGWWRWAEWGRVPPSFKGGTRIGREWRSMFAMRTASEHQRHGPAKDFVIPVPF